MRMVVDDRGAIRPPDEDVDTMRGNAEPAADFIAREDAARDAAMRRMRPMAAGGRVHAEVWKPGAA